MVTNIGIRLTCLAAMVLHLAQGQDRGPQEECKPLEDCPLLKWMMRNKFSMEVRNASQVGNYIRSKNCGNQDRDPYVWCPVEEDDIGGLYIWQ